MSGPMVHGDRPPSKTRRVLAGEALTKLANQYALWFINNETVPWNHLTTAMESLARVQIAVKS